MESGKERRFEKLERFEKEANEAFEKWLSSEVEFINLNFRGRQLLQDYAEGLNNDIANLHWSNYRLTHGENRDQ